MNLRYETSYMQEVGPNYNIGNSNHIHDYAKGMGEVTEARNK